MGNGLSKRAGPAMIDAKSNWGVWEGWGTSLAWWAKRFGDRNDLADVFFTMNDVAFGTQKLPGLGFNIVRYNAGACSWNTVDGQKMNTSPKMRPSRQIEAFWIDWASTDPKSASWNWEADANQRAMLGKARDRGADRFELFSNSPVWWMCKNHNPAGDNNGLDNLQAWNVTQHGVNLITILEHARDNWGINFESIAPFNEPMALWWRGDNGTQEGCHMDAGATQGPLINILRGELDKRGLKSIMIAASDENTYDRAKDTWEAIGSTALANVGRINVHGYQNGQGRRDLLYSYSASRNQKLWNSEYGENDGSGRSLVSNLILDLRWLHPNAWVYWQVLDGGGWGLIDADNETGRLGTATQKYFVLAQFCRHIRPGMRILDGGADNVIAAYDAQRQKLVIVAVNWGSAQNLVFDLSRFSQPSVNGTPVVRWRTQIGTGDQYVKYPNDTHVRGGQITSWFESNTVHTFEVEQVVV